MKPLQETDDQQLEWGQKVAGLNRSVVMECPECGKKMVRRTAKKGLGTGSQFWGCSGYPACKVIQPISQ